MRRERQYTDKHWCDWLITPSVHKSTSTSQTDGTGLTNYRVNNSIIWSTLCSGMSELKWTWNDLKLSVSEPGLWALSLVKLKLHLCDHHYICNVYQKKKKKVNSNNNNNHQKQLVINIICIKYLIYAYKNIIVRDAPIFKLCPIQKGNHYFQAMAII